MTLTKSDVVAITDLQRLLYATSHIKDCIETLEEMACRLESVASYFAPDNDRKIQLEVLAVHRSDLCSVKRELESTIKPLKNIQQKMEKSALTVADDLLESLSI